MKIELVLKEVIGGKTKNMFGEEVDNVVGYLPKIKTSVFIEVGIEAYKVSALGMTLVESVDKLQERILDIIEARKEKIKGSLREEFNVLSDDYNNGYYIDGETYH